MRAGRCIKETEAAVKAAKAQADAEAAATKTEREAAARAQKEAQASAALRPTYGACGTGYIGASLNSQ